MNYPKFAHGYRDRSPQLSEHKTSHEKARDPLLEKEFQQAREWDRYFGSLILKHLNSEQFDVETETRIITNEYIDWSLGEVPRLYKLAKEATLSDFKHNVYFADLGFHLAAPRMEEQWGMLIEPEYVATPRRVTDTQSWLASAAVEIARDRKIRMAAEEKSGERNGIVGRYNGLLTDADTIVTSLEFKKLNAARDLVVVPAPSVFEDTRSTKNVDVLVFDRQRRHARGLQAKTRLGSAEESEESQATLKKYNPAYVTFVDGVADLGNSRGERLVGGRYRTVAWPGLISMDHILRTSAQDMPGVNQPGIDKRTFFMMHRRTQQIARELSGNRRDFIPTAAMHLGERLLADLYRS